MIEPKKPRMPRKYASSIDVARLAGVSQSAVSRTYRPGGVVSDDTRKKVLAAAAELDYRPSVIPRIMLTNRSNLVAVVVGGLYNPFYAKVLESFTVKLQELGHQTLLVHVNSGYSLDAAIPRLASYRVDGVVSALAVLSSQSADELERLKLPVVSFNAVLTNKWVSTVCCDNTGAAREMADHFLQRGARRFAYLAGPDESPANRERLDGFRSRLAEHGITRLDIAGDNFTYESGYAAALKLLRQETRPDAMFCADDLIAIGAMDAIRQEAGLNVPDDIMVAGFDDISAACWAGYRITTFEQDADRMANEALSILTQFSHSDSSFSGIRRVVPARLVERGSTARTG